MTFPKKIFKKTLVFWHFDFVSRTGPRFLRGIVRFTLKKQRILHHTNSVLGGYERVFRIPGTSKRGTARTPGPCLVPTCLSSLAHVRKTSFWRIPLAWTLQEGSPDPPKTMVDPGQASLQGRSRCRLAPLTQSAVADLLSALGLRWREYLTPSNYSHTPIVG